MKEQIYSLIVTFVYPLHMVITKYASHKIKSYNINTRHPLIQYGLSY